MIDALAEEAERGYDLSKWKRELVVRPPFPDSETKARVTIEISNDELSRLRERAEGENKLVSCVAHEALQQYLGL